ncbi:hypothetical protein [Oleiharenicola lentus]|uniref:hypothetical protein n=1 Tax=Oleiharenicola lentus TaxID=2508720 RepID=UPI003F67BB91
MSEIARMRRAACKLEDVTQIRALMVTISKTLLGNPLAERDLCRLKGCVPAALALKSHEFEKAVDQSGGVREIRTLS